MNFGRKTAGILSGGGMLLGLLAVYLWLYRRLTTAVVHGCGRHLPGRDVVVDENGRHSPAPGNGAAADQHGL
ncbi:hypothetical protein ACWDSL_05235 [Streptomyces sp. NPDC000941]